MILLFLPRKWREQIRSHPPYEQCLGYGSWLLVACALLTIGVMHFERLSLGEALWQVWQTVTTIGYGNKPAESSAGRFVVMFFGTIGIAFLGVTIGASLAIQNYRQQKKREGFMNNDAKNGYVVFHYPGPTKFKQFLEEIRFTEPHVPICLVDSELAETPQELARSHNSCFIKGSAIDRDVYERASVRDAKAVVVFPIRAGDPASDAGTAKTAELVSRYVNGGTRVIHSIVDPKNEWLFDNLHSTPVPDSLSAVLLVQEMQDPHSAAVYSHILSNRNDENPVTVRVERLAGVTWCAFVKAVLDEAEEKDIGVNPIALVRERRVMSCPPKTERLEAGDCISLIANGRLNWQEFERDLVHRLAAHH